MGSSSKLTDTQLPGPQAVTLHRVVPACSQLESQNAEHLVVHCRCFHSILQRVLQHPMVWVGPVHLEAFPSMTILQNPDSLV